MVSSETDQPTKSLPVISKKFLKVLAGQKSATPPIWLMRQAGRYLPEYRQICAQTPSFMEFCYNPALAAEATLQPIRRFGFDAAIIFSDILVIPDALGQKVSFDSGEGPRLDPITSVHQIEQIEELSIEKLNPVFEAIDRVKGHLPAETALIGFCGAPWTLASYMIAGKGTPDQAPARLFAYRYPAAFQMLIDKLVSASISYLKRQFDAGAEVVQIFDSWAGVLPAAEFDLWCLKPAEKIVSEVQKQFGKGKVIAFPRGAGTHLPNYAQTVKAAALGLDTTCDLNWAKDNVSEEVVLQGNLDPLVLLAGGKALELAIDEILKKCENRRHIFNLGHGILPQTPIEHVEALLKRVRMGL